MSFPHHVSQGLPRPRQSPKSQFCEVAHMQQLVVPSRIHHPSPYCIRPWLRQKAKQVRKTNEMLHSQAAPLVRPQCPSCRVFSATIAQLEACQFQDYSWTQRMYTSRGRSMAPFEAPASPGDVERFGTQIPRRSPADRELCTHYSLTGPDHAWLLNPDLAILAWFRPFWRPAEHQGSGHNALPVHTARIRCGRKQEGS